MASITNQAPEDAYGAPFAQDALTEDHFLGGAVRLLQPSEGYRAATDPVLLAAATLAAPGDKVLDVGSGAGAAAFCLDARVKGLELRGVELTRAFAHLSEQNAKLNNVVDWRVFRADISAPPAELKAISFDHVISNPPYFSPHRGLASGHWAKDAANRETKPLREWVDFCLKRLKSLGTFTMIHRAERTAEIICALEGRAAGLVVCPLWPRRGAPAKRVIVRAVKDARGPFRRSPGLTLHGEKGGAFSCEAVKVLSQGEALKL